jgi:hypothetical protein
MIEFYVAMPWVGKVALWLIFCMLAFLAWMIWEAERSPTYLDDDMTQRVDDDAEGNTAKERPAAKETSTREV